MMLLQGLHCKTFPTSNTYYINESYEGLGKFHEILFIKKISSGKFPIYLALSKSNKSLYVVKAFPLQAGVINTLFINESRFAGLSHQNIISPLYCETNDSTNKIQKPSFTLMEYAPHESLHQSVMEYQVPFDDKLIRTYIHQLIDGLEYLHSQGIAHLDIKPENLMLGENFELKIIDFDLSYKKGDLKILSEGTRYYRAPELLQKTCMNPYAADIYSAGVILFILKSGGVIPHLESTNYQGFNFFELLQNDPEMFWTKHSYVQGKDPSFWNDDYKDLFMKMTQVNPDKRVTTNDIKNNKWFSGKTYNKAQLREIMKKYYKK